MTVAYELIVIGASLGGLHALSVVLGGLDSAFPLPIVIVQHRHQDSDSVLPAVLQRATSLPVVESEDKQRLEPGTVYLAPADYHLLVEPGSLALSTEGPVMYARPAIDVLFETAADAYAERVIGVILTGASADGAAGLAAIKARGGVTVVQDPATAECRVMPEAALARVTPDYAVPLVTIPALLTQLSHVPKEIV